MRLLVTDDQGDRIEGASIAESLVAGRGHEHLGRVRRFNAWCAARGAGRGFLDMGAAGWFFCCLLLWIVAFPVYLAMRPEDRALCRAGHSRGRRASRFRRRCPI